MIAQKHRFRGHNSVARVRGRSIRLPLFSVYYTHNAKRKDYRMAVVVSKKTAKSAVVRNRIRRRLYESVRTQGLLEETSADVVFVVRDASLAESPAAELAMQVAKACQQIAS